ncbi:MAG: hypothetical protein AAB567_00780 [Patescibacteria group bacterium]
MNNKKKYICRVCGYRNSDAFYDESGYPEYEICPCCGAESGYQDCTPESAEINRRRWLQEGTPWHADEWVQKGIKLDKFDLKPENWNLEEQLRTIGVQLKDYQKE